MDNLIFHLKNLFGQYEVKINEQDFSSLENEINNVLIQNKNRQPLQDISNSQNQKQTQLEQYGDTIIKKIESIKKQPINKILEQESFSTSTHQRENSQLDHYHYYTQ